MDIVEFVGHFDSTEFHVNTVDWDRYQVMDLYDDFQEKGSFYGIPKNFILLYNLPDKPMARKPLESDSDFGNMREAWENKTKIIHLHLKRTKKPSKPQTILESLAKLKQAQQPQVEDDDSLTFSQPPSPSIEINLEGLTFSESPSPPIDPIEPLTTPDEAIEHTVDPIKPIEDRFDPFEPGAPIKTGESVSSRSLFGVVKDKVGDVNYMVQVADDEISISQAQKWASELIVSQQDGSSQKIFEKGQKVSPKKAKNVSPKKAKNVTPQKAKKLPLKKPTSVSQPAPLIDAISPTRRPFTRSLGAAPSIPKSAKLKGKQSQGKQSQSYIPHCGSSKAPRFNPNFSVSHPQQTISLSALGLDEFAHYDIEEICKEPSKYVSDPLDDFWVDVQLMVEEDKGDKEAEKEGEADVEADVEGDDELTDDEEDTSSEDEVDLEQENIRRQQFGQATDDIDDEGIVMNKMAKLFRQGRMWKMNSDGKATLRVGDTFTTKFDLLMVVKDVCILGGFELIKIKSSKNVYTQRCAHKGCTWRIHCSVVVDRYTWMVKTIHGEHINSCGMLEHNKMADPKWVCSKLIDMYKCSKELTVEGMKDEIKKQYGVDLYDHTCWRAKRLMKALVEGKHEEGYKFLPAYCEEFKAKNPNSVCLVKWINQGPDRPPIFSSLVICIGPACQSFVHYCRPFIGIDATHLKGPYRGVMLTALGLDGNNGQFPLAYSVVEKENEEAWTYFLRGLTIALDCVEDQSRYTIISDRHWGIVNALKVVMPKARRRLCVFHYYKNFATQYPGAWFHDMFYLVANAHAEFVYRRAMKLIEEKDKDAYNWLVNSEVPKLWARCTFDPNLKCEDNTNNFVESFNHAIVKFRGKPCLTMLEDIRKLIGRRFVKRFEMANKWAGDLTPFVEKKLQELCKEGRIAKVTHMGGLRFDVEEAKDVNFTVHLNDKFCNCNQWQITGIPCKHVARCIINRKLRIEDFCEPCYSVATYKNLYNHVISPIPSPIMWQPRDLPLLDPPHHQIKTGRPPLHKRRESTTNISSQIQGSATVRCKKCKMIGHNRLTCGRPRDEYGRMIQKRKRPPPPLDENGMRKKRGRRPKNPTSTPMVVGTQQSQTT